MSDDLFDHCFFVFYRVVLDGLDYATGHWWRVISHTFSLVAFRLFT